MSFTLGFNSAFCRLRIFSSQFSRLQISKYLCDSADSKSTKGKTEKNEPSKTIEELLKTIKTQAATDTKGKSKVERPLNLAKPKFQRKEPQHHKKKAKQQVKVKESEPIISAIKDIAADLKDSRAESDLLGKLESYDEEVTEAKHKGIEFRKILGEMNIVSNAKIDAKDKSESLKELAVNKKQQKSHLSRDDSFNSNSSDSDVDVQKVEEEKRFKDIFTGMKIDQKDDGARPADSDDEATKKIKESMKLFRKRRESKFDAFSGKPLNIFNEVASTEPNTMWNKLSKRELRLIGTPAPDNAFEEMIMWTEKGQLWPFPIDNDYGVTEEPDVGFHEHVFIQTELEHGFPKNRSIQTFMELVCVGLSKNPYITVARKKEHIDWFRQYFKEKEHLLTSD